MESAHWIILGMAIIVGICLFMFVRGHVTMKSLATDTDVGKTTDKKSTSSGPAPADKYLPAWVILSMSLAVWVLAYQVNSIVKDVCGTPGRCQTADDEAKAKDAEAKVRVDTKANKTKADEGKVAEANAAPAIAASAVTSASEPKGK